jgi:hypothetical protein
MLIGMQKTLVKGEVHTTSIEQWEQEYVYKHNVIHHDMTQLLSIP